MTAIRLLRAASILALIQYTAHIILFLSATPTRPGESGVVQAMKGNLFKIGLSPRSYWDFYFGYGLLVILAGLLEVGLLWQIATLAKTNPLLIRSIVPWFLFFNVAHAVLAWRYFALLPPVIFDAVVAATLIWAFMLA
jgi:hypothetical protein